MREARSVRPAFHREPGQGPFTARCSACGEWYYVGSCYYYAPRGRCDECDVERGECPASDGPHAAGLDGACVDCGRALPAEVQDA